MCFGARHQTEMHPADERNGIIDGSFRKLAEALRVTST